jgi:hypothetical protein
VIEEAGHGPELCMGVIFASDPPQCEGLRIEHWDWAEVEGEESRGSTAWGDFHVIGRYADGGFTATEVGPAVDEIRPHDERSAACNAPSGRWHSPASFEYTGALDHHLDSQIDIVDRWMTPINTLFAGRSETDAYVLSTVFSGKKERHEDAIRRFWDGPLCVVARDDPTDDEQERLAEEARQELKRLGARPMSWCLCGTVTFDVVLDENGAAQALFDERYGPRVIKVYSALEPVKE